MIEKKEIYGDDLVRLLDAQNFAAPEIDWTDEERLAQVHELLDAIARRAIATGRASGDGAAVELNA